MSATPEEQDEMLERLTWEDEDIVALVRRDRLSVKEPVKRVDARLYWYSRYIKDNEMVKIEQSFFSADGMLFTPDMSKRGIFQQESNTRAMAHQGNCCAISTSYESTNIQDASNHGEDQGDSRQAAPRHGRGNGLPGMSTL